MQNVAIVSIAISVPKNNPIILKNSVIKLIINHDCASKWQITIVYLIQVQK
jgi:hypothetical protein